MEEPTLGAVLVDDAVETSDLCLAAENLGWVVDVVLVRVEDVVEVDGRVSVEVGLVVVVVVVDAVVVRVVPNVDLVDGTRDGAIEERAFGKPLF